MSYSLDDVFPMPAQQYIDEDPVAWMTVGHLLWVIGPALMALTGAGVEWFAVALAHITALILLVVAWRRRFTSVAAARAVAWVSTPLLGISIALVAVVLVIVVWTLRPLGSGVVGLLYFAPAPIAVLLLWVFATVGAFLASVSHARSLRDA